MSPCPGVPGLPSSADPTRPHRPRPCHSPVEAHCLRHPLLSHQALGVPSRTGMGRAVSSPPSSQRFPMMAVASMRCRQELVIHLEDMRGSLTSSRGNNVLGESRWGMAVRGPPAEPPSQLARQMSSGRDHGLTNQHGVGTPALTSLMVPEERGKEKLGRLSKRRSPDTKPEASPMTGEHFCFLEWNDYEPSLRPVVRRGEPRHLLLQALARAPPPI